MEIEVASVYSASRSRQKTTEAPASVTIVTRDEIRRLGHRSLADVLRTVPGFFVSYDRFYNYVGVRGFGRSGDFNSRLLVLLDGHRLNENVYDGVYPETGFPIDVDLIEKIEIIRGPGSSLYGTNAFFGVVNIIPRRGKDIRNVEAAFTAGSLGTTQARASFGHTFGSKADFLLSATTARAEGQRVLDYPDLGGTLVNGDRERADSVFTRFSKGSFSVQGLASSRMKHFPGLYDGQAFDDARNYGRDTRGFVDAKYDLSLGEGRQLEARAYVDRYQFDGFNPYVGEAAGSNVISREFANGTWWGGEILLHQQIGNRHQVTLGSDFRFNRRIRLMTYDSDPYYLYADTRGQTHNASFLIQDDFRLTRRLRVNAGFRYDRYSTFGGAFSPRAGLIFEPAPKTAVKLLYGRAFRSPNSYELFYTTPTYQPNPLLKPENIQTTEVVFERYTGKRYRVAVSAFTSHIANLVNQIENTETNRIQYVNGGGFYSRGAEFEVETRQPFGLQLRASYGLQRVTHQDSRQWLGNSPLHLARATLAYPLPKLRMTAAGNLQYVSRRLTSSRDPNEVARGYFLPSLTLSTSRESERGVDIAVTIVNLANSLYSDPAGEELMIQRVVQNGRVLRLSLIFRM